MSVRPATPHRLAGATKDWSAIGSYQRKPVDLYQQLYSLPEPEKVRWQRIIGISCMVLSVLTVVYFGLEMARGAL